jgi:uncharacterized membrane protein YjfL (UPF0719 family)
MSGDETLALIISGIIAAIIWLRWYWQIPSVRFVGPVPTTWVPLAVTPLLCAALLFVVLRRLASADVRDSGQYLFMYTVIGAAWVGVAFRLLPWFGVSPTRDALERRNMAAALVVAGALVGLTLAFAGGNIGNGPGWWVVVFAAGLASVVLLGGWALVESLTGVSESVAIERDTATGLRLAGLLIAAGLVLGRAAAGDWVSAGATVRDFVAVGWPALLLFAVEVLLHRVFRPSLANPKPAVIPYGLLPALGYVAVAVVYVLRVGRW